MLSKTSKMFQENTIVSIVNDLSNSMEYLDNVEWIGAGMQNFQATFLGNKEKVEITVTDNDYLVLDVENNGVQSGYTYEKKFPSELKSEIDYLREELQGWYVENERERNRMGY